MLYSHSSCMISLHAVLLFDNKEYPHSGLCMWMQWKSAPATKWPGSVAPPVPEPEFWNQKSFARYNKPPLTSFWLTLQTWDAENQNTDELPSFAEITSYKSIYMKRCARSSLSRDSCAWYMISTQEFQQTIRKVPYQGMWGVVPLQS